MSEDPGKRWSDEAALQAYLDGDMPLSEIPAFERRLAEDPALRQRLELFQGLESWTQATRPLPPADLAATILRKIEAEPHPRESLLTRLQDFLRPGKPWIWVTAAAAVAVIMLLLHNPTGHTDLAGGPDLSVSPGTTQVSSAPQPSGSPQGTGASPRAQTPAPTPAQQTAQRPAQCPTHRSEDLAAGSRSGAKSAGDSGAAGKVRCVFNFASAEAHQVCLVGSFNLWTVCNTPLEQAHNGTWTISLDLPRGRYEYMFVVDGKWITDPLAAQKVDDGFGRRNAVLLL